MKTNTIDNKYNELMEIAIKHQNSGHYLEAQSIYLKLKKQSPKNSRLLFLLGSLYGQMGDFEQCINSLNESLLVNPSQIDAYNNLAIAYEYSNQLDQAIQSYNKALELNENSPLIHCNLGDLYRKKRDFSRSLQHLNQSLQLSPANENALINKANLLGEMKKKDEARQTYQQAMTLYPNNVQLLSNYSAFLQLEEDFVEAEKLIRRSININPDYPQALSNLGNLLIKKEAFNEAEEYLLKAIKINPDFTDAHINLGFLYHNVAKFDQALNHFNKAIELDPNSSTGHWYRSFTLLLTGKLASAWDDYEYGLKNGERGVGDYAYPLFNPDAPETKLEDGVLLVTAEQGVGDQVMFLSCLPDILKVTKNIVLECDKRLATLIQRSFSGITTINTNQYDKKSLLNNLPGIQQQIAIGSLPRLFRKSDSEFPNNTPYLIVDQNKHNKWKKRYQALGNKPVVGISWQGGITVDHEKRSMLLDSWKEILQCDCHFINLQYGDHSDELNTFTLKHGITINDWDDSDSLKDLDDFSAQISALDLVISVGNTNVHLAGSLNIPTWCLIPKVPSWRWLFSGTQCLWYPSVKMYRQNNLHEWNPVLQTVKYDLEKYLLSKNN